LAELLRVDPNRVSSRHSGLDHPDAIVSIAGQLFLIECKASGSTAGIAGAIERVREHKGRPPKAATPVIAVPYMGPSGRRLCADAGVSWLDLSGNVNIRAPGLIALIESQPNAFVRRGRPSSVFAPKSSRVIAALLTARAESWTQRELARATALGEGFVSRIVGRLVADELVVRETNGSIHVRDPNLLLDAWREDYDFERHHVVRGHIASRSGEALLPRFADVLGKDPSAYAVTGLPAAWLYSHFAGFRLATVYVREIPTADSLKALGFREEPRGANVWLVVPRDEVVFYASTTREGVSCVNPVQAYLDLKSQPERSAEAATELRKQFLTWGKNA
jgi:hypothetical protein